MGSYVLNVHISMLFGNTIIVISLSCAKINALKAAEIVAIIIDFDNIF
jgi:hypothetical protein